LIYILCYCNQQDLHVLVVIAVYTAFRVSFLEELWLSCCFIWVWNLVSHVRQRT